MKVSFQTVKNVGLCTTFAIGCIYVTYHILDSLYWSTVTSKTVRRNSSKKRKKDAITNSSNISFITIFRKFKELSVLGDVFKNPEILLKDEDIMMSSLVSGGSDNPANVSGEISLPPMGEYGDGAASNGEENHEEEVDENQVLELCSLLSALRKDPRPLETQDLRAVAFLLSSPDENLLVETLGTISNCAAFSVNQERIREGGLTEELKRLLRHDGSQAVQMAAIQAIANLSVNENNQAEFRDDIPYVLSIGQNSDQYPPLMRQTALACLTNLSVMNGDHPTLLSNAQNLLKTAGTESDAAIRFQTLRLLVNMSCDLAGVGRLAECHFPQEFLDTVYEGEDMYLRTLTIMANVAYYISKSDDVLDKASRHLWLSIKSSGVLRKRLKDISHQPDTNAGIQARRIVQAFDIR